MPASETRYSNLQLNYFKLTQIVLDEFPRALRHAFKAMWDKKYPNQTWDDSSKVHNTFSALEGTSIINSYEEWDCTQLFKATIFARTFADSLTGETLRDMYLTKSQPLKGSFRAKGTIITAENRDEKFALAIDQLRLLRNALCHSSSTQTDKSKFQDFIERTREAFKALQFDTRPIDDIINLEESEFPTERQLELQKIIKEIDDEKIINYVSGFIIIVVLLLLIAFLTVATYVRLFHLLDQKPVPSGKTHISETILNSFPRKTVV